MPVQKQKMATVVRQKYSTLPRRERQNFRIRNTRVSLRRLQRGDHIVAQLAKFSHNRQRDFFVGIEPRHYAVSFARICDSISAACDRA